MDGDLISRKALLEKLDERDKLVRKLTANVDDEDEIFVTLSAVRKFVNNRPAVDAEPVRHGTWEMCRKTIKMDFATLTGTYPTCSLCGHAEFGMDKSTPYCPNCGAKMDEEGNRDVYN